MAEERRRLLVGNQDTMTGGTAAYLGSLASGSTVTVSSDYTYCCGTYAIGNLGSSGSYIKSNSSNWTVSHTNGTLSYVSSTRKVTYSNSSYSKTLLFGATLQPVPLYTTTSNISGVTVSTGKYSTIILSISSIVWYDDGESTHYYTPNFYKIFDYATTVSSTTNKYWSMYGPHLTITYAYNADTQTLSLTRTSKSGSGYSPTPGTLVVWGV